MLIHFFALEVHVDLGIAPRDSSTYSSVAVMSTWLGMVLCELEVYGYAPHGN